jgi:hypothetical protein
MTGRYRAGSRPAKNGLVARWPVRRWTGKLPREMPIATDFRSSYWAAARRPGRRSQPRQIRGSSGARTREAAGTDAKTHDSISSGLSTVGYQVVGAEGPLGRVEALRFEHGSEVPFLLVVRDDERLTLVPARRVAQILPESRRLLLSPASSGLGRR